MVAPIAQPAFSPVFEHVLESTGYLRSGKAAQGLSVGDAPKRLQTVFDDKVGLSATAAFSAQETPVSIFKDVGNHPPSEADLANWRDTAWNIAIAPLLWIVTPTELKLYDCYWSRSTHKDVPNSPLLRSVKISDREGLRKINAECGRFSTETGAFWSSDIGRKINRRHRVDRVLLHEIKALEESLIQESQLASGDLTHARGLAQRFIGRCIFTWYLLDRQIAQPRLPKGFPQRLEDMLASKENAFALFGWLRDTFNGDLFPMDDLGAEQEFMSDARLNLLRAFARSESLIENQRGQGRLIKFRFDAIPIELISAIYQQFARSAAAERANDQGLHYTPIELVNLALDPVLEGLPPHARVIDPTCGSGAFLVQAFRHLVWRATLVGSEDPPTNTRSGGRGRRTRSVVWKILREQIFGTDINPSALGIAAFSLYLTALELVDETHDRRDNEDLRFDKLIGETLYRADILGDLPPKMPRTFDAIVGNPPWTYIENVGQKRSTTNVASRPRRSPDHHFLARYAELAGSTGRVGIIMKATPFFSRDSQAIESRSQFLSELAPTALVNLSQLRKDDLFPDAKAPALLFLARCPLVSRDRVLVGSMPRTEDFSRSGVFAIGHSDLRPVALESILSSASALKTTAFGTARDRWLMDKLERRYPTLEDLLNKWGIKQRKESGQGYKLGGIPRRDIPTYYEGMPVLVSRKGGAPKGRAYQPFRLNTHAFESFKNIGQTIYAPRKASIFRGPVLLCPRASGKLAAVYGRYSAAVHEDDLLYSQSFFGISCKTIGKEIALLLSAILNSSITTFQMMMGGSLWGVERPLVEPQDLMALRIPDLGKFDPDAVYACLRIEEMVAREIGGISYDDDVGRRQLLGPLDDVVGDLYGLEPDERTIVNESVSQAVPLALEDADARLKAVLRPSLEEIWNYAEQVVRTVNAYLRLDGGRHLEAVTYSQEVQQIELPGAVVVGFTMRDDAVEDKPAFREGDDGDVVRLVDFLSKNVPDRQSTPYLNERRQLRIYLGDGLFVVKPAETRCWTRTAGLNDADAILADHWR